MTETSGFIQRVGPPNVEIEHIITAFMYLPSEVFDDEWREVATKRLRECERALVDLGRCEGAYQSTMTMIREAREAIGEKNGTLVEDIRAAVRMRDNAVARAERVEKQLYDLFHGPGKCDCHTPPGSIAGLSSSVDPNPLSNPS